MRTLILADRQEITKAGILYLSQQLKIFDSVCDAADKKDLILNLLKTPDAIVVLDYTLFDVGSIEDLFNLRDRFPESDWILFSESLNDEFVKRMVYGARWFSMVQKDDSIDEIMLCLKTSFRGERFICHRVNNRLLKAPVLKEKKNPVLTNTEVEVLKELALGKTTREIATERNLSFHTVITHRKNIFRKIEVNNVHEAIRYAVKSGIVDMAEYYI